MMVMTSRMVAASDTVAASRFMTSASVKPERALSAMRMKLGSSSGASDPAAATAPAATAWAAPVPAVEAAAAAVAAEVAGAFFLSFTNTRMSTTAQAASNEVVQNDMW